MNRYYEAYLRPAAMNMAEGDGKIWMALLNRNGICEVDMATGKARVCKVFEEELLTKEFLYCHVEKVKNYLIFSPNRAEKIAVYDLERDVITYFPLKELGNHCKQSQREGKFWNIVCHGSDVYLPGYSYPAIVKLNVESMELTYITDWVDMVEENIDLGDDCGYFSDGYVLRNNLALLPVGCMSAVLELDFDTDRTKLIKLDAAMKGIGGLSSLDGENVWMVGRGGRTNRIVYWNWRTKMIKEQILEELEEDIYDPFYMPVCTESKVFLMPMSAPYIYEICLNTGRTEKGKVINVPLDNTEKPIFTCWKTMAPKLLDNRLFFLTCNDLKWHEYDIATEELRDYYVRLEEDGKPEGGYFDAVISEQKKENIVPFEKKIPLEYFVKAASNINCINGKENSSYGGNIYRKVCTLRMDI